MSSLSYLSSSLYLSLSSLYLCLCVFVVVVNVCDCGVSGVDNDVVGRSCGGAGDGGLRLVSFIG